MNCLRLTFILFLFYAINAIPQQPPVPDDFAYGMQLELEEDGSLYELTLPSKIYQTVTRDDLGDLRVFNGKREIVPHALRSLRAKTNSTNKTVVLPIFPLYGKVGQNIKGLALRIKKDESGTIVEVQTNNATRNDSRVVAYLLDTSKIDRPIQSLELDWNLVTENFIVKVSVDISDDLETWSQLVTAATVVDLNYENYSLSQRSIPLRQTKAKYYRLSWPKTQEGNVLKSVTAELVGVTIEQPRHWQTMTPVIKDDIRGEYTFTSSGYMPVDRVKVKLPEKNTLVQVTFFSRTHENNDWRLRRVAQIYHLNVEGEEIINPDLVFDPITDPYWLMSVDQSGGGLGQGKPQLEIAWVPHKIVFVARGEGPFTVAYGSAHVKPAYKQGNILPKNLSNQEKNKLEIKSAQTGPQIVLGGESRLKPTISAFDRKQLTLWSILVVGVIFLAWMAMRLYRQMNTDNPSGTA